MAASPERAPNRSDLAVFLAIAFGGSFALAGATYLAGLRLEGLNAIVIGSAYMYFPAIGAIVAEKRRGAKILDSLALKGMPNGWWAVGWLAPFVLAGLAFAIGSAFPGVHVLPSTDAFLDKFAAQIPPEKLADAKAKLAQVPMFVFLGITTVQAALAGPTINAVAAFGEELGWRGYLQRWVEPLGFWRGSFVVGLVWGPWHAALILQGHNYPQHPVLGVALMTVMTVLLAPLLAAVRRGGNSVVAAAVAHGSVNATGGFASMLLAGGSDVTVGMTGGAGFLALLAGNGALWLYLRRRPFAGR